VYYHFISSVWECVGLGRGGFVRPNESSLDPTMNIKGVARWSAKTYNYVVSCHTNYNISIETCWRLKACRTAECWWQIIKKQSNNLCHSEEFTHVAACYCGTSGPKFENFAPGKVDQSSPKYLKTCYAPLPLTVPFHRARPNDVREVLQFFYTLHYFGAPGEHLGWSSPILALMYSKARTTNMPNFVPF